MPSLRSFSPNVNPGSDFSTTNAETLAPRRAVGVGHGEDRVVLRDARVGDPRLLAVEHPVVAVRPRPGLHRRGVGPGLPLGQAVGEPRLAPRQRRQVASLDLLRPREDDRHRAQLVHRRDERRRRADPRDLLDDDAGRERVRAHSVVLLGHVRREEVARHQGVVRLLRVSRLLVDLRRVGRDLVGRDRADRLADRLVLLGQLVQVERRRAHRARLPPGMRAADGRGQATATAGRPGSTPVSRTAISQSARAVSRSREAAEDPTMRGGPVCSIHPEGPT